MVSIAPLRRAPRRPDYERARVELLALAALLLLYCSWLIGRWVPTGTEQFEILILPPIDLLVIYAAWRAARRCDCFPALRGFWLFLAFAWAAELVGDVIQAVYVVGFSHPSFPSLADPFYLAFYPLLLVALLRVPTVRGNRSQRLRMLLDCATILIGGGAAVWYFVLGPTITEGGHDFLATVVSIGYPVGDLVLLAALAAVLMRRSPASLQSSLRLVAAGLLTLIVADMIYGAGVLHGTYSPGDPVDTIYFLVPVPFILAAVRQRLLAADDAGGTVEGSAEPGILASRLPLLGMAVGFGLLLATQLQDTFFPDLSLMLIAVVLAVLVALRQRSAQVELVQLQGRVQTIVENIAEGIVAFDEEGSIVWVNPAAEAYFGAEPDSLEGTRVDLLFDGIDWAQMAPMVGVRGVRGPIIGEHLKFSGRRGDGSTFPAEIVVTEADLDGRRILISIGQDVSERVRAERELKESERRFHGIFDSAGIGIAFSSFTEGRPQIVEVNDAFARITGYSVEELRGNDFSLITHPSDLGDLAEMAAAVEAGEDSIAREPRCVRKDGTVIWGALSVSILREESGEPRYAIGMLADVTARKEAERVKDEFVSVVGHELRTPLTSIRGSLGLLEGGVMGDLPEEAAQMLRTAVSSTDRLVRLINDILDIERMDAGRTGFELAPVSAAWLVEQSIQVVEAIAREAGVELRPEVEETLVDCDADKVIQTLTNLLGNAVKFSEAGGLVSVAAAADAGQALFSVHDDGRGIPSDQLESIFERFSQVDASDAREKGGTGLGLAISRQIVEAHQGRIWAESAEGAGTTFSFTLPLAETRTEAPNQPPAPAR